MCYSGLLILGVRVQTFGRVRSLFTLTVAKGGKTENLSAKDCGPFIIYVKKRLHIQRNERKPRDY